MVQTHVSESLLAEPMYAAAEAGRLVRISGVRVGRWLRGYSYEYRDARRRQRPVIHPTSGAETNFASFLDLVDLLFVRKFLDHRISHQKLRKALDEARHMLGTNHFARQSFFTDGTNIWVQVKEEGAAILELLSGGQWVIPQVILELAHQIEFDPPSGLARRWYPLGPAGHIVLDPFVSFGRPSIVGTGVATSNVLDFFVAEGRRVRPVCRWFDLTQPQVDAALSFEKPLAA